MRAYNLLVYISSLRCQCFESHFSNGFALWKRVFIGTTKSARIIVLKEGLHVPLSVTYFVEHFNVSRSEMMASSEKPADTSWISRWNGVRTAAIGIWSGVARNVSRYEDIVFSIIRTKSRSVVGTTINSIFLILILSQLNWIISVGVVKREDESFTGCGVVARS